MSPASEKDHGVAPEASSLSRATEASKQTVNNLVFVQSEVTPNSKLDQNESLGPDPSIGRKHRRHTIPTGQYPQLG